MAEGPPPPKWNVNKKEFWKYRNFILGLREMLRGSRVSFGVPHLIPWQRTPTEFLDFTLQTSEHQVTFRLRRDDVYLIGYFTEKGQWFEFGSDRRGDCHLIQTATFLGFDSSYLGMCRAAGRKISVGSSNLVGIHVGSASLETAVNRLASPTPGGEYRERAESLIVVIMMICEAIRFNPILDEISKNEAKIEPWMEDMAQNWSKFSRLLAQSAADPTNSEELRLVSSDNEDKKNKKKEKVYTIPLPSTDLALPSTSGGTVSTNYQVSQILGIILHFLYIRAELETKKPKKPRSINDDDDEYCIPGLPLVEIFSVRIDNIDDENPGQLYGTIAVDDGFTQYIYNRPRSHAESIRPGENITMIGPIQSIWAQRSFTIHFLLTDSDVWSRDEEVVKDSIEFDGLEFHNSTMYDRPISQQVKGKKGSATVNYAVFSNAVTALVTIKLQQGGENPVDVYGTVVAKCRVRSDFYPNTTSLLFNRSEDNYLQVRRWHNIPLLKSIVAVPLGVSLHITVNLFDYDIFSANDRVANGTAAFPAKLSGESSVDIFGEDGHFVTVTVSWGEAIAPHGDRGYDLRPGGDEL